MRERRWLRRVAPVSPIAVEQPEELRSYLFELDKLARAVELRRHAAYVQLSTLHDRLRTLVAFLLERRR